MASKRALAHNFTDALNRGALAVAGDALRASGNNFHAINVLLRQFRQIGRANAGRIVSMAAQSRGTIKAAGKRPDRAAFLKDIPVDPTLRMRLEAGQRIVYTFGTFLPGRGRLVNRYITFKVQSDRPLSADELAAAARLRLREVIGSPKMRTARRQGYTVADIEPELILVARGF